MEVAVFLLHGQFVAQVAVLGNGGAVVVGGEAGVGGAGPAPVRAAEDHVVVEGGNTGAVVQSRPLAVEVGVDKAFTGRGVEGRAPRGKGATLCFRNEVG